MLAVALLMSARPALAQIDYRNLDDGRPVRVEDAYPVERYAFEFLLPYGFEQDHGGGAIHALVPELAYGLLRNFHLGVKLPLAASDSGAGGSAWGLSGVRAFALYNFTTDSPRLPAIALRVDGYFPAGELGGEGVKGGATLIATRSFGSSRLHVNGAWGVGRFDSRAVVEGGEQWWYGAALDRTLFRQSVLLIGEVYARRPSDAEPVEVNASVGGRWQWTPTTVLDLGVSRRLRAAGPDLAFTFGLSHAFAVRALMPHGRPAVSLPPSGRDGRDEQFYYPGSFNWTFLHDYPQAARMFNAFDYGHAVLYERLTTARGPADSALAAEYRYLTTDLLVRPPRFAVAEEAIEPHYARLAWKAKLMFDWAHVLHRQIYDVHADERLSEAEKDSLVERLTDYYLSNRRLALAPVPKSMALMDDQYFSQVFRRRHAAFNGLIWAYHWLQVGLYEPLIAGRNAEERRAGVAAAVARFWQMLRDPPTSMPRVMPMTATIAPRFTARHPRAAAIFDNLHMLHDVISDILASEAVARADKRAVIYAQLAAFQDGTREVMTRADWLMMGEMMGGAEAMGGAVPLRR